MVEKTLVSNAARPFRLPRNVSFPFDAKTGFPELLLELLSVLSIYPSSFISNPSSSPLCPRVKGQLYLLGL